MKENTEIKNSTNVATHQCDSGFNEIKDCQACNNVSLLAAWNGLVAAFRRDPRQARGARGLEFRIGEWVRLRNQI